MRLERLRAQLDEHKLDALLVTQPDNRRYLSGFTGSAGQLLVARDHALLFADSRYWEQATDQAKAFELVKVKDKPFETICEHATQMGLKRLGFESRDVSVDTFERLREAGQAGGLEWTPARDLVERLRWVKDEGELAALRRAIVLTDEALHWLLTWLKPGQSELAVAWELERYMRERGASGLSFESIVASGPNSARPHARPSERLIGANEPLTIDMGAIVDGYHADLTRTLCLGEPDEQFLKVYNTVLAAQLAAERGLKAGLTGKEGDALARDVIAEAGYGDNFGHSLGHGVGLATHEGPSLSPRIEDDRLPVGATVTVEPGIYLPGWGGVRIEDIVVIRADGADVLSQATKEPRVALEGVRA